MFTIAHSTTDLADSFAVGNDAVKLCHCSALASIAPVRCNLLLLPLLLVPAAVALSVALPAAIVPSVTLTKVAVGIMATSALCIVSVVTVVGS
jgi:hypothetical protein